MRRSVVVIGFVFLLVGIILAFYSTGESYSEEEIVTEWDDIWPSTLNPPPDPQNATFWGSYVQIGDWIEFDLSFSGSVRVTVSALQQADQKLTPIFDEVGTVFDQKVAVPGSGTYQVDIKNEGLSAVDIIPGSSVAVKTNVTSYGTSYPYSAIGVLTACGGAVVLILGLLSKSRKARKKS